MKLEIVRVLCFATLLLSVISLSVAETNQDRRLPKLSDKKRVYLDLKEIQIPIGYQKNLHWNLVLDSIGINRSSIQWQSSNPEYISNKGILLKRSPRNGEKVKVTMTATLSSGKIKATKSFDIYVAYQEPQYDGYLFAFFEGSGIPENQEQLRFGVSVDAFSWYALNNNQPIMSSNEISESGGVRDPHIIRGEDEHSFYMVATDMNSVKYGWGANPGIVLLRSNDLINWTHGYIDLEKTYPKKFSNVKWIWAPQTIYDPSVDKYLVYFTVCYKNETSLDFYCAYANKDFTALEAEPKLMFSPKYGAIDGDIIYKDGVYHFFYKGNTKNRVGKEIKNGIQQAFSRTLQGPWVEDFKYLDAYANTTVGVEGSSIFKLNNSETYVLMYDLYRKHRYEYQRTNDLYNFTPISESFTKNFYPRHGTVMSITREEANRINEKWGGVPDRLLSGGTEIE